MIKISEPKQPKLEDLKRMSPELMPLDAGFTGENYKALCSHVKSMEKATLNEGIVSILNDSALEPDFYNFFTLYDFAIKYDKKTRYALPEIGYSPYNFLLMIKCIGVDKRGIAELLDWSFSKVSVNTAIRNSEHFMPMVGEQWGDFVRYFIEVLRSSDSKFGVERDYNKLFYLVGGRKKALELPA